mgnify:FL=1
MVHAPVDEVTDDYAAVVGGLNAQRSSANNLRLLPTLPLLPSAVGQIGRVGQGFVHRTLGYTNAVSAGKSSMLRSTADATR